MKFAGAVLLMAGLGFSQALKNPAARTHVKMVNGVATKFTSKLQTVVELNFTLGNGHQPGKKIITDALTRIVTNYGGLKINKFASASDGSVVGTIPNFTVTDLMAGEVIVANNISAFGDSKMASKQAGIQSTIETNGRGYLGFHGSGDNQASGWPWFTSTLHPMNYQGHENRSVAPVYKHLATAKHIVMDSILLTKTVDAIVPNELDAAGTNEVLSTSAVPTRKMMNEWYRFGRDISRDATFKDKVTILLKYDGRALTDNELDATYKRKGGNMYTYLYKVGAGMTSYIPAGHENDELLSASTGFDGGVGDFDRYVAQTLFFLAGYTQTACDASCNGLRVVNADNMLTGEVYTGGGTSTGPKIVAIHPELNFNTSAMGFSSTIEKKYIATVLDIRGHVVSQMSGVGKVSHDYTQDHFKPGVYLLKVQIGNLAPQTKRYVITPAI